MQSQEIQQSKKKTASPDWNKWDVILLVVPTLCVFLVSFGGLFYLCGRFSPYSICFMVCPIYPVLGIFIIYCFIADIVRLFRGWRKATRRKKLALFAEISIPLVSIALFVASFFIPEDSHLNWPPFKSFAYGFKDRVRSKGDIESIRDLLRTFGKPDEREIAPRIPYEDWPKLLKALNPKSVVLCEDKKGTTYIRARWGGGFQPWGMVIGMENMDIPPSDLKVSGEYRLPLEPGVYIWFGL
jgi:hypothetical protein